MKKHLNDLAWREVKSPLGRFHLFQKDISLALGGIKDKGPEAGGHPFDVALVKLPPKGINWPEHTHTAQCELYIILSGTGAVLLEGVRHTITAGDCFMAKPGQRHQIENTSPQDDLLYYVVADNPSTDIIFYPNSNKWFIKPQRKCFVMGEVDYYSNEDG